MLNASEKRIALIASVIAIELFVAFLLPNAEEHYAYIAHYDQQGFNSFLALLAYLEGVIDAHEKLFIVLATIAIAWFTRTLYQATSGLLDAAEQQKADMRESLDIAKQSAESTALQTRAFVASQIPIIAWVDQKLIEIGDRGVVTHDPARPGNPPLVSKLVIQVINLGPTSAVFTRLGMRLHVTKELPAIPHYENMVGLRNALSEKQSQHFTTERQWSLNSEEYTAILQGTKRLWAYGFITYADFLDETHEMGFCFRWDMESSQGLVSDGPEAYTYYKHDKNYSKLPE